MLNIASVIINLACIIYPSFLFPYIGGPSVYEARAIVYSQNPDLIFNDQDLCANIAMRKRRVITINHLNNAIQVYPNPSNQIFQFESYSIQENDKVRIEIKDVTGRIIMIQESIGIHKVAVDLSEQLSGLYLYEYSLNGNPINIGNLVLIK
ncbi:MAG: Secretion system C-terminal sorting domain [Bacteroidota bacterium]|jgi:hypothetical protein